MSGTLSRRSLLAGAGYAAAGTLVAQVISAAEASQAASLCMNMIFMNDQKAKLDPERFTRTHVPLLRKVYGDTVERIEFRYAQSPSQGMPPSPILATSHIWITDVQGFVKALGAGAAQITADLDKTAKGSRISQVDRVAVGVGEPIAEVKVGSQVMTTFYPLQEGKDLNKDYFTNTHIPKLLPIYGGSAVRRIEGTLGQDQGTSKATYVATTHIYIRTRSDYEKKATGNMGEMIEDAKKFTTIFPQFAELRVQAIG
jgi:hypothetical protein